jgi:hypothetical protein
MMEEPKRLRKMLATFRKMVTKIVDKKCWNISEKCWKKAKKKKNVVQHFKKCCNILKILTKIIDETNIS